MLHIVTELNRHTRINTEVNQGEDTQKINLLAVVFLNKMG